MSKPALMRRMPQIAHVDVNCFYASAERAFDPSLEGKPTRSFVHDWTLSATRVIWQIVEIAPPFGNEPGQGGRPVKPEDVVSLGVIAAVAR